MAFRLNKHGMIEILVETEDQASTCWLPFSPILEAALDRVLTWPPERQEDVVRLLDEMAEQDASNYRLSDEQVAEVKRRMADPNPQVLTLEEFNERFKDRSEP